MARITALLAELEATLTTAYGAVGSPIAFGFGAKDIDEHNGVPRVVWIHTTSAHDASEKQASGSRSVLTRRPAIVAHCWCQTYDELEELVHQVILAGHAAAWGSVMFDGEEWPAELLTHHGVVALVKFNVRVPVLKSPPQTVQARTLVAEATGAASGDGSIEWSET
jgi:hypothetical protein